MSAEEKLKFKPGYVDTIQIVLLMFKSFGLIDWPWWMVFTPWMAALGIAIICGIIIGIDKLIEKE